MPYSHDTSLNRHWGWALTIWLSLMLNPGSLLIRCIVVTQITQFRPSLGLQDWFPTVTCSWGACAPWKICKSHARWTRRQTHVRLVWVRELSYMIPRVWGPAIKAVPCRLSPGNLLGRHVDIFKSMSFSLKKSIGYGRNVTVYNVSSSILINW